MNANSMVAAATLLLAVGAWTTSSPAQTRDELVRRDRAAIIDDDSWYYDNLQEGIQAAKASGKPLMVVLRCIP